MKFIQFNEIQSYCGTIHIYQTTESNTSKYWLSIKDVTNIMLHYQQTNLSVDENGEIMVPLSLVLHLLFKMEVEDVSIRLAIDALQEVCGFNTSNLLTLSTVIPSPLRSSSSSIATTIVASPSPTPPVTPSLTPPVNPPLTPPVTPPLTSIITPLSTSPPLSTLFVASPSTLPITSSLDDLLSVLSSQSPFSSFFHCQHHHSRITHKKAMYCICN